MKVSVRYFALLKERLGKDRETVELPDGASVSELLSRLSERQPFVAASRKAVQVAVNQEFMPETTVLADGDEVALIPPVAGGAPHVRLSQTPLDPAEVFSAVAAPGQGGIVMFVGIVRDHNEGKEVVRLDYEAYDDMALKKMADLAARIEGEHAGAKVAMVHRVGSLSVGDAAVVLAASAPHRPEAFAACRAAIEALKHEVPIWKKEFSKDGATWLGFPNDDPKASNKG
ncbi:MAG TPA: molybdopterin converting factor subunit 1 [Pseudomonadota bacterium]|nr:molybdopterin converting factor subunit 1 [Pseudomonadota bacterium]